MPHISIIVPCHNSQKTLTSCLTAIRASTYKNFELIVVDDHSNDRTVPIAETFCDKIIRLSENKGSGHARKTGIEHSAASDIICFVDSDILIKADTLAVIADFLDQHPEIDAVTGLLAKEHPNQDFFSQYKNLYMNYIFNLLPERVTFLFGSICAVKRKSCIPADNNLRHTPDTEFGQKLLVHGKTIAFSKDLQVVHLKKYSAVSLLKNDFNIPFSWAKIFIRFNGLSQLGKNKTGFAHAPKEQLASLIIAPSLLLLFPASLYFPSFVILSYPLLMVWLGLNYRFFIFLFKEQGTLFLLASIAITFIDHLVMALGVVCGFCYESVQRSSKINT